jgi:polysaccharide deacetylase 2 family uncharacterized protein YibQ
MAVTAKSAASGEAVSRSPAKRLLRAMLFLMAAAAGATAALLIARLEQDGTTPHAMLRLVESDAPHEAAPPSHDTAQGQPAGPGQPASGAPGAETAAAANALPPVPDPALVKMGRNGPLPIIGADGRRPREVYARPFDTADRRPRIALVIGGLGLSRSMTESAIKTLPPAVTVSFTPYAKDLQLMVNEARAAGHEVLLELPMEPFDYPHNDPGPYTLLTQSDPDENLDKLDWLLSRFTGYAGVVSDQGDRLLSSLEDLKPVLVALNSRGLYFLDQGKAKRSMVSMVGHETGLVAGQAFTTVDQRASRAGIDQRLLQLEEVAREKGAAIGMGDAFPVTIERIKAWAENLEAKGVALAPVSAALAAPPPRQASQ